MSTDAPSPSTLQPQDPPDGHPPLDDTLPGDPSPGAAAPPAESPSGPAAARTDLRMLVLGAAAWAGGLLALLGPWWLPTGGVAAALTVAGLAWRHGRRFGLLLGCVLVGSAVAFCALVRTQANTTGPVARLAEERAVVTLLARVSGDPVTREGRHGPYVVVRLSVREVTGRGHTYATQVPVVALADESWSALQFGSLVVVHGRLEPADDAEVSAVLAGSPRPGVRAPPAWPFTAAESVRHGIRTSVTGSRPDAAALVPALVVGDDRGMSADLMEDFRTCGLTHLAAVSGTNLTLAVGFLLVVARAVGVRGRVLTLVGMAGVAGFVLVARPEPSVVRAAAMGSVALVSLGARGRTRGPRALGVATVVLLLLDPWLVLSAGFALSVLATGGILFLAPLFRDRMCRWLPRWAAEAVAVPFAAQLVCTPVVAALSGQVSLVAVVANMLVAPVVAPATVLGLGAGVVQLALPAVGGVIGLAAGACGTWIVLVATHLARLPAAAVGWPLGAASLVLLTLVCAATAWSSSWVLARRRRTAAVALVLGVVMVRPLPTPGWPPDGWLLVACDVGQGDGLVLHAGDDRAVVVDAGPDPTTMRTCLRRLDVDEVPVVVLTHFHADHVGGLPGVFAAADVGTVLITGLRDPTTAASQVDAEAADEDAMVRVAVQGEAGQVGDVRWRVLGPPDPPPSPGSEGSAANNASLVLLVEVRGMRVLLPGDVEPEAQALLRRSLPGLTVDVLKVPHHGSRYQDPSWLEGLRARVALVSVGEGNDYGHPAAETLAVLEATHALVSRTDRDGDIAVVRDGRSLRVVTRRPE